MTDHIDKVKNHVRFQFKYIISFSILFYVLSLTGQILSNIYFKYYDKTKYYDITNPITVEKRQNFLCSYIDAYIHRKVLVPIQGTSVRQLTLVRKNDGRSQRIKPYTTDIQAEVGEGTMVVHWRLPCDSEEAPPGTYYFEGMVSYKVGDITKYTHFITENFEVMATSSALMAL